MKQDILLIAPPSEYLANVCTALTQAQMSVSYARDTNGVIAMLEQHSPAFLLLDIELDASETFFEQITNKAFHPPPYILVAATFANGSERANILNLGADICINKPIDSEEVIALIHAVLRREGRAARLNIGKYLPCIEYKGLFIDPLRRVVMMQGKITVLTTKEFDILHLLASNPGAVLTKENIYLSVWKSEQSPAAARISDYIFSLRKKLGLRKNDTEYIQTIFGVGYRFAETWQQTV